MPDWGLAILSAGVTYVDGFDGYFRLSILV